MKGLLIITLATLTARGFDAGMFAQQAQSSAPESPVAAFRSSIELVRLSAVVRDKKGRFVNGLTKADFEITDGGVQRTIADFRQDAAPITVAMLFDVSGSMEARMTNAQEAAMHLLRRFNSDDEAAMFTFDTRLDEVRTFTSGVQELPSRLASIRPFGATSLHDAIAKTAEKVAKRNSLRRAVIVFTDGQDTASTLSASDVSGMASAIDVPVYVIGIVPSIDNPLADTSTTTFERSALTGSLSNLAYWTGGDVFVVSSIAERSLMASNLIDELRRQYLIAFEASTAQGWRPLTVRTRTKDMTVRARSGYFAGRSRPTSH